MDFSEAFVADILGRSRFALSMPATERARRAADMNLSTPSLG
jgi:hypothetical protein